MEIHDRVREILSPMLPVAMEIARRYGLPADFRAGNRPRHFAGNLADPLAVRLIVLLAEPGSSPGEEEKNRSDATWLEDVSCDGLGNGGFRLRYDGHSQSLYEKNPRDFIAMLWPKESYADRMKKTIISNSFWMQALGSGAGIPSGAAKNLGVYLNKFTELFPNAIVVAAGDKAKKRCDWAGIRNIGMAALTPPGSNRLENRDTWRHAANNVRTMLG